MLVYDFQAQHNSFSLAVVSSISEIVVCTILQAVTKLLNDETISDVDRLRLVMLYALRYEKESPVQLMQLFNKLASHSAKYKPGVT